MHTKNTLIVLLIIMFISTFLFAIGIADKNGIIHELKAKIDKGVVSPKKITPEIELTTDGKTVDTLYIYKWTE